MGAGILKDGIKENMYSMMRICGKFSWRHFIETENKELK